MFFKVFEFFEKQQVCSSQRAGYLQVFWNFVNSEWFLGEKYRTYSPLPTVESYNKRPIDSSEFSFLSEWEEGERKTCVQENSEDAKPDGLFEEFCASREKMLEKREQPLEQRSVRAAQRALLPRPLRLCSLRPALRTDCRTLWKQPRESGSVLNQQRQLR